VAARGRCRGVDDPTVGQNHLQPDHHVLDLPVSGRVLAAAQANSPRRWRDPWTGPVAEGDAVGRSPASRSGRTSRRPRQQRRGIDVDDPAQAHMSRPPPEGGDAGPAHPDRPAMAVTGTRPSWQTESTAATWPVSVGRTPPRRAGTAPGWPSEWPTATSRGPPPRGRRRPPRSRGRHLRAEREEHHRRPPRSGRRSVTPKRSVDRRDRRGDEGLIRSARSLTSERSHEAARRARPGATSARPLGPRG